ncbi:MAG: AzlC family ABC transporter permease [Senegalimassilia faecalis]
MKLSNDIQPAVQAAIPIVLGYIAIGIPCGILEDSIGLNAVQVLFLSCMFYSGAGQFIVRTCGWRAVPSRRSWPACRW